jgi:hypothetical protein
MHADRLRQPLRRLRRALAAIIRREAAEALRRCGWPGSGR